MSDRYHDDIRELGNCHDCGAKPGQPHTKGCDTERCSVCGGQRLMCLFRTNGKGCKGHDRLFARWTGLWPGWAEAKALGMDLNDLERTGNFQYIFIKPKLKKKKRKNSGECTGKLGCPMHPEEMEEK